MGSAAIVLVVFAEHSLERWTGNPTLTIGAAPILRVLAFGLCSRVHGDPYRMQLAHGWTELTIKMNFVALAMLMPTLFYVVPRYGGIGARGSGSRLTVDTCCLEFTSCTCKYWQLRMLARAGHGPATSAAVTGFGLPLIERAASGRHDD